MASYSSLMAGGESGESIVAGNANSSALFELVRDKKMPPRRGLRPRELKLLQEWIDGGASFDGPDQAVELRSLVPAGARGTAGGAGSGQGGSAPEETLDRTTSRRQ
jgi:hypothetical protein